MAFAGDLLSISLPDIFQNLSQNERTGRLHIEGTDVFDIFFRKGKVAGVEKPNDGVDEVMYGVLRNRGTITPDEFDRVRKKRKSPAGPISTALKMKLITKRDAGELLQFYVTERVLDVFGGDTGTFAFHEGDDAFQGTLTEWTSFPLDIEPSKLLFEAARRADEWSRIKKNIISEDEIFTNCINIRESVREGINGEDLEIFVLVDGLRTLREVADASRETKFLVYSAVSRLLESKMIRPLQVNQTQRLAQSLFQEGNYTKCIEVARKGLSMERNTPVLRHVLALALARTGEEALAAEELKLLALSFIDEGHPDKARDIYREVVEIVPSDVDSRQRIFDLTVAHHPTEDALAEGKAFVAALREFGLNARARDVLEQLMDMAPDDFALQDIYARVCFDLGDKPRAVKTYRLVADRLREEDRLSEARKIYALIVELAPEDEAARRTLNELQDDLYQARKRRRTLLKRGGLLVAGVALFLTWIVYDFVARAAFVETNREIAVAMADNDWNGALDHLKKFRNGHPFSTSQAAARRQVWTLRSLACLDEAKKSRAAGRHSEARQWIDEAFARARSHLEDDDPLFAFIEKKRGEMK
jgi:tetratricopeptide (TPR) repeat protein